MSARKAAPKRSAPKGPSFTVNSGPYAGRRFVHLSRVSVAQVHEDKSWTEFTFHAFRWWPVVDGKRSAHGVVLSSTLHKLLTRAAALTS